MIQAGYSKARMSMTDERRRSPRIELMGRLDGHSASLDLSVKVVQMSVGGMAIETAVPLPAGTVHVFRLTLGDDSTTDLSGRIMHSRNTAPDGATPVFRTGVQFVDDENEPSDDVGGDLLSRVR